MRENTYKMCKRKPIFNGKELEKDFIELEDTELKDREVKMEREKEELFL